MSAAADLFGSGGGTLPSVAEIAERSGIAKGTVYLYFQTKETIFSALLLEGWGNVVDLLQPAFKAADARPNIRVDRFLRAYVAYLDGHRDLLRLDALRPVLQRNLERETLRTFKQTFLDRLAAGGTTIDRALELEPGRGLKLLMRTHALTCGLWQSFGDGEAIDEPLADHPDFFRELPEALEEYWRGVLQYERSRATRVHDTARRTRPDRSF